MHFKQKHGSFQALICQKLRKLKRMHLEWTQNFQKVTKDCCHQLTFHTFHMNSEPCFCADTGLDRFSICVHWFSCMYDGFVHMFMHAKLHEHTAVTVGANLHCLTYNVLIDIVSLTGGLKIDESRKLG